MKCLRKKGFTGEVEWDGAVFKPRQAGCAVQEGSTNRVNQQGWPRGAAEKLGNQPQLSFLGRAGSPGITNGIKRGKEALDLARIV